MPKRLRQPISYARAWLAKYSVDRATGIPAQTVRSLTFTNIPTSPATGASPFSWAWSSEGMATLAEDFKGFDDDTALETSDDWIAAPTDESNGTTAKGVFYDGYGLFHRTEELTVAKAFLFPQAMSGTEEISVHLHNDGGSMTFFGVSLTSQISFYVLAYFQSGDFKVSIFGIGVVHTIEDLDEWTGTIKIDMDSSSNQYDLYVDDELVYENAPYIQPGSSVDGILFSSNGGSAPTTIKVYSIDLSWMESSTVSILYYKNSQWVTHHESIPNAGSYAGTIPDESITTKFRIRSDVYTWAYDTTTDIEIT